MDSSKVKKNENFPLVDALLFLPPDAEEGIIGVCTNTTAPGQVFNDIEEKYRKYTSVLGPLIVSRDGSERMIINSIVHPNLRYLILFSEESTTFAPSTNLLQAIMNGLDTKKSGNYINKGIARSAHYPNINKKILDYFRKEVIVLPLFKYENKESEQIITDYLEWIKSRIDKEVHAFLTKINQKKKIYYDSLNELIGLIARMNVDKKPEITLDPKQFQHLQPPRIELPPLKIDLPETPFLVEKSGNNVKLTIKLDEKIYTLSSDNTFLLAYSLMKFMGKKKKLLTPTQQLLLGAELARVETEIMNNISHDPFIKPMAPSKGEVVSLQSATQLKTDKKYYYKINVRGDKLSVMCLAFDVCEEVFELISSSALTIVKELAKKNRFEEYEMDILHRIDIGIQIGRASIAAENNYAFIQDFSLIFKINKDKLPFAVVVGDSFLDVHKNILRTIYTKGITEEHGDERKGLARTASVLAVYRNMSQALKEMPLIYKQGEHPTKVMRKEYRKQLLRKTHDGTYTYGERTCTYFGFNQLKNTIDKLKSNPKKAAIIQRFDPSHDMGTHKDPDTGEIKFTHDPCLTHDIYFIQDKRLHAFHIARAHNAVNAYPENIFGLYDAYSSTIAKELKIPLGDMYVLSNRANILLLTEEGRTKKILSEPSKPPASTDSTIGPHLIGKNIKFPKKGGVIYERVSGEKISNFKESPSIDNLRNYRGVDTIKRAIKYLATKGVSHNNPILTEYFAGEGDPQESQLAYFQANVFGGKTYGTAVFMNRDIKKYKEDKKVCQYLLNLFAKGLKRPIGELIIISVKYF